MMGVSVLLVGFVVTIITILVIGQTVDHTLRQIGTTDFEAATQIQKLLALFSSQTRSYKDAILVGDAERLKSAQTDEQNIQQSFGKLGSSTQLASLQSAYTDYATRANHVYRQLTSGNADPQLLVAAKELDENKTVLEGKFRDLAEAASTNLQNNISRLEESFHASQYWIIIANLGCALLGIIGIVLILKRWIIKDLRQYLADLDASANSVLEASKNIAQASEAGTQQAVQLSTNVEETSSELNSIGQMAQNNDISAQQAKVRAEETAQAMTVVMESLQALNAKIQQTVTNGTQMSSIIKTIDTIAFQTNLLALNAAVEAARAGDTGAGFAVVADEVRNLASQSAASAQNTSSLIENAQHLITAITQLATEVHQAITTVATGMTEISHLNTSIATASRQQTGAVEQINQSVEDISAALQTNTARTEESSSVAAELEQMAEKAHHSVRALRVMIEGRERVVE